MSIVSLKSLTIISNLTILDAMKKLNSSSVKTLFVIDKDNYVLGTLSDGDVRRNLISGYNFKTKLKNIVTKKYLSFYKGFQKAKALELMKSKNINIAPILNKNKKLIDYIIKDQIISNIKNQIVIMAGGKGTRLLPLTKRIPKPMININNKPILEHIIENIKKEGFSNLIVSINHLGSIIKEHLKQRKYFGISISFINEKKPLGTCGSLSLLKKKPKEPFIVCNGDIISEIKFSDLLNYHIANKADVTITTKSHEIQNPYGVVKTLNNKIVEIEEKPLIKSDINVGAYVLSSKVLKFLKKNKYIDMTDFLSILIKKQKKIIAYPIYEPWKDIGSINDLKSAQNDFKKKRKK